MMAGGKLDNEQEHWLPPEFGTEIFRCQVGSGIHGVTITGYDDRDEMGICIEPERNVIGLERFDQWIYRTQPEGARSGYGDLDLVVYSLRKWVKLALAGNPTVLTPLFAPKHEVVLTTLRGEDLRSSSERFLSRLTASRYIGYMVSQREQLLGLRGRKHTNRPELVEIHGFDTKFAYHMVRLGIQGVELLTTGTVTLPMSEPDRTWLQELRAGHHTMAEAIGRAADLEAQLVHLRDHSDLPGQPDYAWAEAWLIESYQAQWALARIQKGI